jgi:hypothetical protein
MNSYKQKIIYERSKSIPIPQHSPTNKKVSFRENEYSLNNSFFDPSKSSPPNDFLLKLQLRMNQYNSFNNVDNFINE